ncbi:class I adenylate-forming enzyme family protein [Kitasatospora purpeofusca]|uniref:class I adenylate-forming enzyme family protein n=1 Tax=Kitasatospora purpeofusca TaxID=67352 RepID=UPI0030F34937
MSDESSSPNNATSAATATATPSPVAPLAAREQLMAEPGLGAGNFLDHALAVNPNRAVPFAFSHHLDHRGAVVLRGHSLQDLAALRDRYAAWYHANGVRPGEPVAVVIAEGLEPLLHFLALTALGAVPALVNDAMRHDVMVRYLNHVGVVGVVADDTTRLAAAYRQDPQRRPRFIALAAEIQAFDADASGGLPAEYPYRHAADDVVALIHSSGTTGTPKSTMLAHRQFWDGKQPRMVRFPAEPEDRLMSLMPHTHAGGLSYFLTATLLGLPTVVMADWRRSVVEPVMEAFRPTMVASFPRTFVELATGELPVAGAAKVHSWFNTGDSAHYGHIRRLVQLGERPAGLIRPWLLPQEKAEQPALPGSQFVDGLGSSEMGMALFGQVTTPESVRNDRCVGKPLEVVRRAAVLDQDGNELPDGTVGLLGIDSPSRTPGYWNNARLTESFELAGYWLTGDLARRDAEGRFYHLDRTVDVIDTAAGPVYSLPVEEVLLADCAELVRDCSVIGVPGAAGEGQRPVAVVQLQHDAESVTADEVLEAANKALAGAGLAALAAVRIARAAADFPLGPTGKVLKRELRTRFATLFTAQ